MKTQSIKLAQILPLFAIPIIVLVLLVLKTNPAHAAPIDKFPVTVTQPDGTQINLFASGDEFYNWLQDAQGYTVIQDPDTGYYVYADLVKEKLVPTKFVAGKANPASVGLRPYLNISPEQMEKIRQTFLDQTKRDVRKIGSAPHTGTINNLVVFIRFAGEPEFIDATSKYADMFNNSAAGANSLRNYYKEVSYNALELDSTFFPTLGTIVVSYQANHSRGYFQPYNVIMNPDGYKGGDNGTDRRVREHALLRDAVNYVNGLEQFPEGASIDGDGDGCVDSLTFVVSGSPNGWASLLWPHKWSLSTYTVTINGKTVREYSFHLNSMLNSGVLAHEMFHVLGGPDLYHYSGNGISPVGDWDVMGHDPDPPQHMGCYMKFKYGDWISSIPELTSTGTYTLNPLTSSTNNCYKIASPYSATEFFIVEYRNKTSSTFESSLPGTGLIVYRIDTWAGNGNASGPPDEIYIYRPGGTTSLNGNVSDANFSSNVGRVAINDSTNPSSFLADGSVGGLNICHVGAANATISFDICPASVFSIRGNTGVGEVTLSYMDGTLKTVTSNWDGLYSIPVPSGWSGTVTPSKTGYSFSPTSRSYTDVLANQADQDYSATDITAPSVLYSWLADYNPSNSASVGFIFMFSKPVTGVDMADFSLYKTGILSGEFITSVSGGPDIYTITVNTGTGNGSLRLDIIDTPSIQDLAGRTLVGPYTSGDSYMIYKTVPDTQIDTQPTNPSNSANASFTFSSSDSTSTFECSLDSGVYIPCVSPKNYSGLANGSHVFSARAKDPAGNVDATPASYVWAIDSMHTAGVLYTTSSGVGDCSSWANACSLQTALAIAIYGDEIWAATGTHKPTTGLDRNATFQLKGGVAVYGGFAGMETARDQRNPSANITVLSGDLKGNDNSNVDMFEPTRADNSYHVVTGATGATLDGFTVTAGNANGYFNNTYRGGGIYNTFGSNPMLTSLVFIGNSAGVGGGMSNSSSSPTLTNVTFDGNLASEGGGISNSVSSPTLINVTFDGNSANRGGAMSNSSSSPTLTNVTFSGNSASYNGGGMSNSFSSPTLTNVTFSQNSAEEGGGIHNAADSNPQIRNTIFWGNAAIIDEAQIYNEASSPLVQNSIVQGGCPAGSTCTNTFSTDPVLGTFANYGGFTQTIPLMAGSSAIDRGDDGYCTSTDQRGIPRPQGAHCDIGAYEYDSNTGIYYAKSLASGIGNCSSWANACTLQTALSTATNGNEIWVAAGTHRPTTGLDRSATFQLKSGVAIYGGFAGMETALDRRNPATNVTRLSGDLKGNDNSNVNMYEPSRADNSYHVVTGATGATLDGFTITAGNAAGSPNDMGGGGMYNALGSNPMLVNIIFSRNSAQYGGGMSNTTSSPTLANVTFDDNSASYYGGGMLNSANSNPMLTNVVFSRNSASSGGGMSNYSSNPTLTNVTFSNNSAGDGGGMFNYSSNPKLTNVTFSGNSADEGGGGMFNGSGSPTLTNVTFSGNSADEGGGGMLNGSSSPQIRNTIFWDNTSKFFGEQIYNPHASSMPNVSDSVVQGGCPAGTICTSIITTNPMLGTLSDHGGFSQTIPLLENSSAIDTGNDAVCPDTDQRGVTRPGNGSCDIGAYEYDWEADKSKDKAKTLPITGFAPNQISILPVQPVVKAYSTYGDLTLEIPTIGVKTSIVGVPETTDGWDVTWLEDNAGWLNGTAFPTWNGNSLITGHVWGANNNPGIFFDLKKLKYGDRVKIHAWGEIYTYEVRENRVISPSSINIALKHEDLAWITLLTCEDFNLLFAKYSSRRIVRAVLLSVTGE